VRLLRSTWSADLRVERLFGSLVRPVESAKADATDASLGLIGATHPPFALQDIFINSLGRYSYGLPRRLRNCQTPTATLAEPMDIMALQSPFKIGPSKIRVREISEADIPEISGLLARGFQSRPREFWLWMLGCLTERSTPAKLPRYGYLLESDGIVGVILQIFSRLGSGDTNTIRCNVSSWYVEPAFRTYASLLAAKALRHANVTYLNITPTPNTLSILKAQGYSQYSRGIFVAAPALQFRSGGAIRVVRAEACRPAHADQFDHDLMLEHAKFGCISLWCETPDHAYPFVFRPSVVKGVVNCALLVYCHDVNDFVRFAGPIGRFLAVRGRVLVLIDSNGPIPGLIGKYLDVKMPKYFKGPNCPRLGDLAYTETAMFGI
jgi:hypothetical protein